MQDEDGVSQIYTPETDTIILTNVTTLNLILKIKIVTSIYQTQVAPVLKLKHPKVEAAIID